VNAIHSSLAPLPVNAFDVERRIFFAEVTKLLADETVTHEDKAVEIESTIKVLRHLAYAVGVRPDA
jgi:hypothetical protein